MDFREYSAAFHAKNDDVLHFGILGMKWGIRRYQNEDGSLTAAGKKRYSDDELDEIKKAAQRGGIIGGLMAKRKIDKRKKEAAKNGSNNQENTDKKDTKDTEESSNKKQPSKKLSKDLQQIRDSFKSNEARNKWQKAAETDMYDLDFLEYTQNDYDEMSESEARKARLKDYAKYCKDRKKFMTRWS